MTIDDEERQATQEVISALQRSVQMWRQRAEAAEREVQKLTAMLDGQVRLAQENAKEFDKARTGVEHGVMVAASLYQQWQDATKRAEAAEAKLALVDEYAAAKCDDLYNDSLTFATWLQSRA